MSAMNWAVWVALAGAVLAILGALWHIHWVSVTNAPPARWAAFAGFHLAFFGMCLAVAASGVAVVVAMVAS